MKVILSYGSYFNYGKKYQIKFVYDNQNEIECIADLMNKLKTTKMFNFYYLDNNGNISSKNTNIFGGTDIKKDVLHTFISMLLALKNTEVIIGKYKFTDYEQKSIEQAINKLHINATLNIGKYFNYNKTYYVIFKYATEEQKDEILYEFHNNLNTIAGTNSERVNNGEEYIIPFLVDRFGNFELKENNIIGGINIPKDLLEELIKNFIEEHNMVINIGTEVLKDKFDITKFQSAIQKITPTRTRKKTYV